MTDAKGGPEAGVLRVIVLADDLIWASRLVGQLRTLGVDPIRVGSADAFAAVVAAAPPISPGSRVAAGPPAADEGMPAAVEGTLAADEGMPAADEGMPAADEGMPPSHAVVDLTARAYDGLAAVRLAAGAGLRVLCVGQHDDHELRRAALAAGADRVFAYRKLFEDGHATLAAWLGVPSPAAGSLSMPPRPEVPQP